ASCSSNDRNPLGKILTIGLNSGSDGWEVDGTGVAPGLDPGDGLTALGAMVAVHGPAAVWRKIRRSSAKSQAVVYRSVARLDSALRQTRSNSLGIVSS